MKQVLLWRRMIQVSDNKILQYTSRDYDSIKKDLIEAIPGLTNLWTSTEDGDPGIVLVKLMSALGDMLSFNFDKQALEYYGPTVTQRKNAAKLFELIGYKMHWYRSATTTVNITYLAEMEEYMSYYKRIVDKESEIDVYYDYRVRYIHNYNDTSPNYNISLPPIINSDGTQYPDVYGNRKTISLSGEPNQTTSPDVSIKTNVNFQAHAAQFKEYAKEIYNIWKQNNKRGLHTYIEDPFLSLELYSSNYSEPVYSLIPQTIKPNIDNDGNYEPTIDIYPYETISLPAIQGSLCTTKFKTNMLKDNCFYLPDSNVDDTHMYLGYTTIDTNTQTEVMVFVDRVDNLLTASDGELHFQFGVDEFDYPYIELSSYWKNKVGEQSVTFTLYYFRTMGQYGNITNNYIKKLNVSYSSDLDITNVANNEYVIDANGKTVSSPGFNPQTAAEAYKESLNYVMTYDTIVTIYDFMRFTRRQDGISNAFACDGQHAKDLNKKLLELCNNYTRQQLISILGTDLNNASVETLRNCLYNIRKINYKYTDNAVTIDQAQGTSPSTDFVNYSINIYPICGDYLTKNDEGISIAKYTNQVGSIYPYKLYHIITNELDGTTGPVELQLDNALEEVKVANVKARYTACRVFGWRACGTIHLTKSVSKDEANKIIETVINTIATVYKVDNMTFGEKINYMELIDVIVSSDERIRYFDAGMGDKKLIEFENLISEADSEDYFSPEAYFNSESIMKYNQDSQECIYNENSIYYNYITVDPEYILT